MVVLVTGCRSGFGLHIAVECARRGHTVYAGLRDVETRDRLVAAAGSLDVRPVQLDITVAAERDAVIARIMAEQGRIDAVVNNAGIALGGFLEQVDEDELRRILEVNVIGQWGVTCAALPAMREQRSGKVVMISSGSGFMALPGLGAYATSKFALEGLSESWRHELALFDIEMYLVEPGAYATDIFGRNKNLCRRAEDPDDPWARHSRGLLERFSTAAATMARDPAELGVAVADLIEGPRRGLRLPIGPGTRLRATLKKGPWWLVERTVRRRLLGG